MTMTLATEFTYKLQVEELSSRANVSSHKARTAIKAYRNVIKQHLFSGHKVIVPGLVSLYPSVRATVREVFEVISEYNDQLESASKEVHYSIEELDNLLKTYLSILRTKLEMGYEIRIAGVFLITPEEIRDGVYGYSTRLSPALEKPDTLQLKLQKVDGTIEEHTIEKEKLIYRLSLDETLRPPERLHNSIDKIKENIHFLDEDMFI